MNKTYQYSILSYRHSKVLNESINLGLLVYSRDDRRLDFIYPKHLARLTTIYPNVSTSLIRKFLRSFENRAMSLTQKWSNIQTLSFDEDLSKLIKDLFLDIDATSLHFSSISKGIYKDFSPLRDYLRSQFFSFYDGQKSEKYDEVRITDFISNRLKSAPIKAFEKFNREIEISNGITFERFPYSWINGHENILVPISFDLEQKDSIKRKSYQWYGVLESFQEISVEKSYNFDLFITRPKFRENFKIYDQAVSVIDNTSTSKRIVEQDGFNRYLDDAVETLLSSNH